MAIAETEYFQRIKPHLSGSEHEATLRQAFGHLIANREIRMMIRQGEWSNSNPGLIMLNDSMAKLIKRLKTTRNFKPDKVDNLDSRKLPKELSMRISSIRDHPFFTNKGNPYLKLERVIFRGELERALKEYQIFVSKQFQSYMQKHKELAPNEFNEGLRRLNKTGQLLYRIKEAREFLKTLPEK